MESVLILIDPAATLLSPGIVAAAADSLNREGGRVGAPLWLAPDEAAEIPFAGLAPERAEDALRRLPEAASLEVAILPREGRRKKLLVADMDSTIVEGETLDELAGFVGMKDEVAAITARAMNGEIEYRQSLRERVGLLKGLSAEALEKTLARTRLSPGARTLAATMRAHGAHTLLVSSGFRFFTSRIRALAGFDADVGNELIVENGTIVGRVAEPILDKDAKRRTLIENAARLGLMLEQTLAVGDGANDLPMIQAAGMGVAFHAKPTVDAAAPTRIRRADLTALLYLQGYPKSAFAG
ncbi:MAG: phosphoserine phosphatase SerB [Alphaproteobacteria bacterium]|nr:phosphoserine phosphatase SerB [Alphaproteobacteria bacterium]